MFLGKHLRCWRRAIETKVYLNPNIDTRALCRRHVRQELPW